MQKTQNRKKKISRVYPPPLMRGSSCGIPFTYSLNLHIIALVLDALSLRADLQPTRTPYSLRLLESRHLSEVAECPPENRSGDFQRKRNAVICRPCLCEDRHPPRPL